MTSTINWPKKSGLYKIVQLELDSRPFIIFPENSISKKHGLILMAFLEDSGINYKKNDDCFPMPEGDRYKVHGMGKSDVDVEKKIATFFGNSFGYGVGINKEHLERIKKETDWEIKY